MTLTFDLNIKIIFSPWIWVWQNVFALWHRHTKFWHIGVSPWDNMLSTFLTLVWPLIYMWGAGGILSEFYSQFLSCLFLLHFVGTKFCGIWKLQLYFDCSDSLNRQFLKRYIWILFWIQPLRLEGHRKILTSLVLGNVSNPKKLCSAAEDYIIVWNIHQAQENAEKGEWLNIATPLITRI